MASGLRGHGKDWALLSVTWEVRVSFKQGSDSLCPLLSRMALALASFLRIILRGTKGETGKSVEKLLEQSI